MLGRFRRRLDGCRKHSKTSSSSWRFTNDWCYYTKRIPHNRKDAALERRFQPVTVSEPSTKETLTILNGLKPKYEDFHEVVYSPEALTAAVELSARYIQDRHLPDKAIDLMDEVGSKYNLSIEKLDENTVSERVARLEDEKNQALQMEDYERQPKFVMKLLA